MKSHPINQEYGWAAREFDQAQLGDERLKNRLIKLADRLSEFPESSINQACSDWADAKAAYRFFKNEKVEGPGLKLLVVATL